MITSLLEMLELPNFGHMTPSTIPFEPHDKILLVTSWTELMTSNSIFQNTFILRRPKVANFAGIIKIVTMIVKTIFEDSKKVKKIRIYVPKCNLYLYFLI